LRDFAIFEISIQKYEDMYSTKVRRTFRLNTSQKLQNVGGTGKKLSFWALQTM